MSDKNSLSPGTLFRDLSLNFIAGMVASVLSGLVAGKGWIVYVISFAVFFCAFFFICIWRKYKPVFKIITSGFAGYYPAFGSQENAAIGKSVRRSFYYLGISCDSIMENLRPMFQENPRAEYRILLMSPDSDALIRQVAFEQGYGFEQKITEMRSVQAIIDATAVAGQRIKSAAALLKSMQVFRDQHLQVRYYNEFTPWWMYCVDGNKIYAGILEKGTRGSESAVIMMKKNEQATTPFDAFYHQWQRLWEESTPV